MANRANLKKGLKGPQKMRYQMGGDFMEPNKELTFGGTYQKGGPKSKRVDPDRRVSRLKRRGMRNFDPEIVRPATPLRVVEARNKSMSFEEKQKIAREKNEGIKKLYPSIGEIRENSYRRGNEMSETQATLKALAGYGAESRATMGEATVEGKKKRRNKQQMGGKVQSKTLKQTNIPSKPVKTPGKINPRKITKL
jgi:hypothetical protein